MANRTNSLSHTKWVCKYHIVFVLLVLFKKVLTNLGK